MKIAGVNITGCPIDSLHPVELLIEAGVITALQPAASPSSLWLAPGFIDLQVNGYGGIDFNNPATTTAQIAQAIRRLWATGVTHLLPTVITGSHEHIAACFAKLVKAADEFPEVASATLGFHLEGPFISTEDGPRGAHPRAHARPPSWDEFARWQDAARGRIRLVTLAPEWDGALAFIERATAAGVIVALGHTAATPSQIRAAVNAGAKLSTHLGNGSHAQIARHPNYIWEQLAADELHASFIVDGHHLPPAVVKCFLRAKTVARSILVTDAIAAAGCPPGRYQLGEVAVEVTPHGRVCLPGTPYLAGSALEMHEAIAKTVRFSDATLAEALRMATANPAALLGLSNTHGQLAVGRAANAVLLRWQDEALEVVATVCGGTMVFKRMEYTR